jgi:hypothetical protein
MTPSGIEPATFQLVTHKKADFREKNASFIWITVREMKSNTVLSLRKKLFKLRD